MFLSLIAAEGCGMVYIIMIGMFRQAQRNRLILHDPMDAVMFPKFHKKPQSKIRVLSREEQRAFLEQAIDSKYYDFYLIALQTGMRINEILALEWSDIDFQKKEIHVNGTLVYAEGGALWDTAIRVDIKKIISGIKEKGMEFAPITPHTFRHTFAARCIEQGMPMQVLKTILGHSSLAMTADLYSHVLPDVKRVEMNKIVGIF